MALASFGAAQRLIGGFANTQRRALLRPLPSSSLEVDEAFGRPSALRRLKSVCFSVLMYGIPLHAGAIDDNDDDDNDED